MPLKLMFYQDTYIAIIFQEEHMVYLGDSQVVMLLPHFHLNGEDLTNNHA